MTEMLNSLDNNNYIEPTKMTVSKWLDIWVSEYKTNAVKPTTLINYNAKIKNHIKPAIGGNQLKSLRTDQVQKMINEFHNKGLSPETIRGIYNIIHEALKQALHNDLVIKNVGDMVKLPKIIKKQVEVLSPEEQERFIAVAKNTYLGEVFIFALGTGMRIGELLGLQWSGLSAENSSLTVKRTLNIVKDSNDEKWIKDFGTPKTRSSNREIPLIPVLVELLDICKKEQETNIKLLNGSYENNDLVFATQLGRPLDPRNMQRTLKRIVDEACVKNINIHCLRHTFATRGLENGIPLVVMKDLLGHSSIKMTADLYTYVLPNQKSLEIAKIGNTIIL